jgi:2'-5' RNA ligase
MARPETPAQRLFFAVPLPAEWRSPLTALQQRLAQSGVRVKWVEPQNLHLTLRFLGDQPDSRQGQLTEIAQTVAAGHPAFELALQGVGAFPEVRRPRTLWVGTGAGQEELTALGGELSQALEAAGVVAPEGKPWSAHCTLGRVRQEGGLGPLSAALAAESFTSAPWPVRSFVLYASRLSSAGPVYQSLQTFDLATAGSVS